MLSGKIFALLLFYVTLGDCWYLSTTYAPYVVTCTVPDVANGAYSDCTEGAVVDERTVCTLTCDMNYPASVTSVTCGSAGTFDTPNPTCYKDANCKALSDRGLTQDGVYTIDPDGAGAFDVYCHMDASRQDGATGPGWTVFQRRVDASVDFFRTWTEYENGFGDLTGNFWLGLSKIARLTPSATALHVYVEEFDGTWAHADYTSFKIADASDNYRIAVSGYSGNALDGLAYHNGHPFSTKDRNNDGRGCSNRWKGAWWYYGCHESNLNGRYLTLADGVVGDGILWRDNGRYALSKKTAAMKLQ